MKPTIYVAGPMKGYPEFNYPAFHEAEEKLLIAGYEVKNPARDCICRPLAPTYEDYIKCGLQRLMASQAVALLPGWEASVGARLEVSVAATCGLKIKSLDEWLWL